MSQEYLHSFPEGGEITEQVFPHVIGAYQNLITSLIDNRTIVDYIGPANVPASQVSTSDLGLGLTYTPVRQDYVLYRFTDLTNEMYQRALVNTSSRDATGPVLLISQDGEDINRIPVGLFLRMGDPTFAVAQQFRGVHEVATMVTEKMLLHPDNYIKWMTAIDHKAREDDQFQPVLNALIDYAIKAFPINARIIHKMTQNGFIDQSNARAYEHDILEFNPITDSTGKPIMSELYTVEYSTQEQEVETQKGTKISRNVKITHRVGVKTNEDNTTKHGVIGDTTMTVGTNEVEKLKSNWSNNRVMSSGTAYLHISSLDTGHLAISHSDTAQNPNIKINTGSSIYSLMYQAKDVTKWYEPKIYDINGAEVQVEDIPIRDKIIISKLLISCVDNIFNTADQE